MGESFKVRPEDLRHGGKVLANLSGQVARAGVSVDVDGYLPTLDPLSKAMAVVAAIAGGPLAPMTGDLGYGGGKLLADRTDPYPGIQQAWVSALGRYGKYLLDDSFRLDATAKAYEQSDQKAKDGLPELWDPKTAPSMLPPERHYTGGRGVSPGQLPSTLSGPLPNVPSSGGRGGLGGH